ncbi:MAG: gamma subclass chorismate mutase AroQ [Alphaproteobacteria bacterium]
MKTLLLALLLVLPGTALATDRVVPSEVLRLAELVGHRLELMPAVAAWKWRNNKPIEDLAREARVLDATSSRAAALGIDPLTARAFLAAQIDASKQIQQHHFDHWQDTGFLDEFADQDLVTHLRPAISAAGDAILEQLVVVRPMLDDPWAKQALAEILVARDGHIGLKQDAAAAIVEAAARIEFVTVPATVLDAVLARGVLRVGTTGDYAPFSSFAEDGYTGIDIDLARSLADSLGVEIAWVQTSWPTLMDDFLAAKFDIGMSGISRTLLRQRDGYFSDPYHTGGKTPIVRCGEEAQFDTLDEINQPDVRVIVNPGGTNQKFVDANIDQAQVRVFPDNRTVFTEIAEGRADVMVTDQIEVRLQSAKQPVLCPSMQGTFTRSEKGFLMPRDEAWLHYVNLWLEQAKRDGVLSRIFAHHLGPASSALP